MLIIVTSFLPIFFLGEREGRLFNPLAFSKTFAMAFSTLLTLFLLPVVIVWVFKRDVAPADVAARARSCAAYRRGAAVDDSAPLCVRRRQRRAAGASDDGHAPVPEGLHAGDGRGLHPLHADDAARAAVARGGLDSSSRWTAS